MEPWPEVLAFAQPLAPVVVSAALAPVAALLSAATVASPEEEVAAAEAALGEAVAVVPSEVVAADGSLSAAFAEADSPAAASLEVAAVVSSQAARAEYLAARAGFDFRLAHLGRWVAAQPGVAGD